MRLLRRVWALGMLGSAAMAAAEPAAAADSRWSTQLSLEERYDDNITQLSQKDIDRLNSSGGGSGSGCGSGSTNTSGGRFTITTPGDIISVPRLSTEIRAGWLRARPTAFDVDLATYIYSTNPIKDYSSIRLAIGQPLQETAAHQTTVGVSYNLVPSFYLRNLRSDRTGEDLGLVPAPRREATYRREDSQFRLEQVIVSNRFRVVGIVGNERRNYNPCFDERDSRMPYQEADLIWDARPDRIRVRLSYRHEDLQAQGDLSGTVFFTEDDISSRRNVWAGDVRFRWGRKGRKRSVRLRYENEARDYTTPNPNDIFHFGRRDRRSYLTVSGQIELRKAWSLSFGAERDRNSSTFPTTLGSTFQPEDTTDYTENLVQFGFGYEFGVGGRRGGAGRLTGSPRD